MLAQSKLLRKERSARKHVAQDVVIDPEWVQNRLNGRPQPIIEAPGWRDISIPGTQDDMQAPTTLESSPIVPLQMTLTETVTMTSSSEVAIQSETQPADVDLDAVIVQNQLNSTEASRSSITITRDQLELGITT